MKTNTKTAPITVAAVWSADTTNHQLSEVYHAIRTRLSLRGEPMPVGLTQARQMFALRVAAALSPDAIVEPFDAFEAEGLHITVTKDHTGASALVIDPWGVEHEGYGRTVAIALIRVARAYAEGRTVIRDGHEDPPLPLRTLRARAKRELAARLQRRPAARIPALA